MSRERDRDRTPYAVRFFCIGDQGHAELNDDHSFLLGDPNRWRNCPRKLQLARCGQHQEDS